MATFFSFPLPFPVNFEPFSSIRDVFVVAVATAAPFVDVLSFLITWTSELSFFEPVGGLALTERSSSILESESEESSRPFRFFNTWSFAISLVGLEASLPASELEDEEVDVLASDDVELESESESSTELGAESALCFVCFCFCFISLSANVPPSSASFLTSSFSSVASELFPEVNVLLESRSNFRFLLILALASFSFKTVESASLDSSSD